MAVFFFCVVKYRYLAALEVFCLKKEKDILKVVASDCFYVLKSCKNVLVGISGGSDSVALAHILLTVKKAEGFNFNIVALHVNHLLRGEESFRDENFVMGFCKKLSIELKILRVNVGNEARKVKKSTEETARMIRYNFFYKIASEKEGSVIALAHTLTDSIETAILNFVRGTGIDGLCGIKNRDIVLRPLLKLTKKDTIKYCNINNLNYVNDSSNNCLKYSRNKIRHKILSVFEEINKNFQKSFSRTFSLLEKDSFFLESLAKEKLQICKIEKNVYDALFFKELPFSISSRCVRLAVNDFFLEHKEKSFSGLSFSSVNLILNFIKKGFGTVELTRNIFLEVFNNMIKIYERKNVENERENNEFCFSLKEMLTEHKKNYIIKIVDFSYLSKDLFGDGICRTLLDYDVVPEDAVFRTRLPGDRFSLPFRNVTKSLKKFFNESKVLKEERDGIPLIASGSKVFWVEGFGASRDCCVRNEKTKRVLIVERNCAEIGLI